MTPEQLDEIRDRHAAATPGPWDTTSHGDAILTNHHYPPGAVPPPSTVIIQDDTTLRWEDAEFVAASWEDIGRLCGEVDRLRAENQQLRYALRTQVLALDLAAVPPPLADMRALAGLDPEGYPK